MVVTGIGKGAGAMADHLTAARAELVVAGQVDWAGKAADRYRSVLDAALLALVDLCAAADATQWASVRHQAAVDAARAGVGT
jgi:hypothetical protein